MVEPDWALLFADSSRLSAKILWCLCVINRCHERNIEHPGAIVIGEDNNESTRWIAGEGAVAATDFVFYFDNSPAFQRWV